MQDLPWGHIVELVQKLDDRNTRDWYVQRAGAWTRAQLQAYIATRLHERAGAAITNFERTLEADDAEAVQRITRDPVVLDFVQLAEGAKERDLETALLADIERFMLALGEGFYFAGRQKSLEIGGEEFILDLLFFHHPTRRFVVIDLKLGPFKAEFAGKMNLYVNAVNALIAHPEDRATVGFILCAGRNEAVAHLTLQGIATPIAVTRYNVGERGVLMTGEEAQITEGLEEEMERCVAWSSRSPSSPLGGRGSWRRTPKRSSHRDRTTGQVRSCRSRCILDRFRLWQLSRTGSSPARDRRDGCTPV